MSVRPRILVVDDENAVRVAIQVNLGKRGMDVELASDPQEAITLLQERPFDLVLSDVKMPGSSGLELLSTVRERWSDVPVVIMTGYGSVEDAVQAMKAGAADYIIKPIARDELIVILERALEQRAMRAELVQLRQEVDARYGFENLVGVTPAMQELYRDIATVADTSATVLLQGPTGTGKELFAHALHYRSPRAHRPFVRVNCAAIPENLLESELFGHEKGAFSGAVRQHRGKFEQADGGTVLLDEVGEIEPSMQVKMLRVLENGEFQRVGGDQNLRADVRVVAATNKNLREEVKAGRFREDLFYRLNVVTLKIPSLAERKEDIPLLVEHFLQKYAEREGGDVPRVASASMDRLMGYHWPGNVRQLEHLVERAIILYRDEDTVHIPLPDDALPDPVQQPAPSLLPPGATLPDALKDYERRVVIGALEEAGGVQAKAARKLGVSRSNLNYRIQKLEIRLRDLQYE